MGLLNELKEAYTEGNLEEVKRKLQVCQNVELENKDEWFDFIHELFRSPLVKSEVCLKHLLECPNEKIVGCAQEVGYSRYVLEGLLDMLAESIVTQLDYRQVAQAVASGATGFTFRVPVDVEPGNTVILAMHSKYLAKRHNQPGRLSLGDVCTALDAGINWSNLTLPDS